jgi:hypothetical protein
MITAVFWNVTPCGSCKNQHFGGTYHVHHQGDKIGELGTTLAVTSNQSTLQRNIPEDGILKFSLVFVHPIKSPHTGSLCCCCCISSLERNLAKITLLKMV